MTTTCEQTYDVPETIVIDPQTPDKDVSEGFYRSLSGAPIRELFHFGEGETHFDPRSSGTEQLPFSD